MVSAIRDAPEVERPLLIDRLLTTLNEVSPGAAGLVAAVVAALIGDDVRMRELQADYPLLPIELPFHPPAVDLLIFVAKPDERDAVLAALGTDGDSAQPVEVAPEIEILASRTSFGTVGVGWSGTSGMNEAAVAAGVMLAAVKPKAAAMIGMAAGHESLTVGDVAVAEAVWNYEFQKISARSTRDEQPADTDRLLPPEAIFAAKSEGPSHSSLKYCEDLPLREPTWASDVVARAVAHFGSTPGEYSDGRSRFERGSATEISRCHVLSGNKLREDDNLSALMSSFHPRAKVVDMESAAFGYACVERDVPWLVIRAVADHGGSRRDKTWQKHATFVATDYLLRSIKHRLLFKSIPFERTNTPTTI